MSQPSAEATLDEVGFGASVEEVTHHAEAGTVVTQTPQGGAELAARSLVELEVSDGSGEPPTMPFLVTLSREEATSILDNLYVDVQVVEVPVDEPQKVGNVVDQSPEHNTELNDDQTVRLQVGRPQRDEDPEPRPSPQPSPTPTPGASSVPTLPDDDSDSSRDTDGDASDSDRDATQDRDAAQDRDATEETDRPGNGNDDAPGQGNGNDDLPGQGNGNDDEPGQGNGNDDPPGRGNDDPPGQGNGNDDEFGRGNGNGANNATTSGVADDKGLL